MSGDEESSSEESASEAEEKEQEDVEVKVTEEITVTETVVLNEKTDGEVKEEEIVKTEAKADEKSYEVREIDTTRGRHETENECKFDPERGLDETDVTVLGSILLEDSVQEKHHVEEPAEELITEVKREVVEAEVVQETVRKENEPDNSHGLQSTLETTMKEGEPEEEFQPPSVREAIAQFSKPEMSRSEQTRVISNAAPAAMNSHTNDFPARLSLQLHSTTITTPDPVGTPSSKRTGTTQSSIYLRGPAESRTVLNPNWPGSIATAVRNVGPPPPAYTHPVEPAIPPSRTPPRKLSATTPYIGSHVISAETGPSLTVLLRRPSSERQWGFTFYGGAEYGCPPFVNKVTRNGLAAQNGVEVGDVIVSICKALTVGKTQDQLKAELLRAGNDLDMVLIRRGVDLSKLSQTVPQILPSVGGSVSSSTVFITNTATNNHSNGAIKSRSAQPLSHGRSFRNIKTKSVRILEEQLASGQTPSSILTTKQHFQGARGLPSSGANSSFTKAYGQTPNTGYGGRISSNRVQETVTWNASPAAYASPPPSSGVNQPMYSTELSISPGSVYRQEPPLHQAPYSSNWDTQSDFGLRQWSVSTNQQQWASPPAPPQSAYSQPQYVAYPAPSYSNQVYPHQRQYSNTENHQGAFQNAPRWQGHPY